MQTVVVWLVETRQVKAISHKHSCVLDNCVALMRHVSAEVQKTVIR
jgi:hypothetical protein